MKFTANLEFFIFLLSTAHAEKGNYPRYNKEIIDSGPTDLFQNKSVAYFDPNRNTFQFF